MLGAKRLVDGFVLPYVFLNRNTKAELLSIQQIVNAASMLGVVSHPNTPCYSPAKHAVVGMTKQMAIDYAQDRIHVR